MVFRTLWLFFHTLVTNTCSKLKVEKLYWSSGYGQSQQYKQKNDGMLHLFLNLNTCILILFFLLLTLNMYLSVGHMRKSTKQLKCTFKNRAVSLKHVHVTWVKQHCLNKPWTIESTVHMIIVVELLEKVELVKTLVGPGAG